MNMFPSPQKELKDVIKVKDLKRDITLGYQGGPALSTRVFISRDAFQLQSESRNLLLLVFGFLP